MSLIIDIPAANPRLSNYAVGAIPQDLAFIDRIAPVQRVMTQTGRYLNYSAPLKPRDDRIGPNTDPWPQVTYSATEQVWTAAAHGEEHPVPKLQDAAAYIQQQKNGVFLTSRQVQFNKVYAMLTYLADANNYVGFTASPVAKFNTNTTDVRAYYRGLRRVSGLGVKRNVLVMGEDVQEAILANTVFLASFSNFALLPGNDEGMQSFLAQYLGVDELIVLDLEYNTAADGQTAVYDDVWPAETTLFFHRGELAPAGIASADEAGRPLIEEATPSFIRQLVWTGVEGAPQGIASWNIDDPIPGFGVTLVRSAQIYAPPVIQMPGAGYLSTNVLA